MQPLLRLSRTIKLAYDFKRWEHHLPFGHVAIYFFHLIILLFGFGIPLKSTFHLKQSAGWSDNGKTNGSLNPNFVCKALRSHPKSNWSLWSENDASVAEKNCPVGRNQEQNPRLSAWTGWILVVWTFIAWICVKVPLVHVKLPFGMHQYWYQYLVPIPGLSSLLVLIKTCADTTTSYVICTSCVYDEQINFLFNLCLYCSFLNERIYWKSLWSESWGLSLKSTRYEDLQDWTHCS